MSDHSMTKLGMISLRLSILGVVVPIVVAFLSHTFVEDDLKPYYTLCVILFLGLEFIALVCGIVGRSNPAGKAGLGISGVLLGTSILYALYLIFGAAGHPHMKESAKNMSGNEIVASRCTACHSLEPDVRKIGPSLHGLLGREVKLSSGKVFPRDKDYIKRSITDPDAEIVETFSEGICSTRSRMKLRRVEAVVEFLTGPETGNKPSPAKESDEKK